MSVFLGADGAFGLQVIHCQEVAFEMNAVRHGEVPDAPFHARITR